MVIIHYRPSPPTVGVFNDKDIYCEMKELIRHILREHIIEQKEKWDVDRLRKITSNYDNLTEFLKNEKNAATALRRSGLYDEFTLHMKRQSESFTDDEIEKEARKYENQADFAKGSPKHYQAFKRRKLQSKFRSFLPTKNTKWTDEMLRNEAKKYTSMVDFLNKSQSAYKTAYDRGILDDITKHIPKTKIWTYDEAKEEALKYDNFPDFVKNSPAFHQSKKNGWTEDFKKFLKLGKFEWKKYTKDMVMADVAKSVNKNDFRDKFPISYKAARENGWYDEVTAPLVVAIDDRTRLVYVFEFSDKSVYIGLTVNEKRRKFGHLDLEDVTSPVAMHIIKTGLEPVYKIINKDLTPSESQDMEACTLEKYRLEGWNILNRYKTGSLGSCRRFWTKEMVEKIAAKYTSRGEFKKNDINAYQAAQKYGWLKDVTKNMTYTDTTVWNYEKTKQLASTVNSRSQLKYASQSAYTSALKNGWLDEFFPVKLKNQFDKRN